MYGALRETQEELGIDTGRIEVLGEIGPSELNMRGDMRVWPFVVSVFRQLNCVRIYEAESESEGFCPLF